MTDAEVEVDLKIDQLVAERIMCDRPEVRWAASQDGGKSIALWTDNLVTKQVVEDFCAKYPQYAVVRREIWERYSGNMLVAWRVVKKMREAGWSFTLEWNKETKYSPTSMLTDARAVFSGAEEPFIGCCVDADPARAICLAALKAKGIDPPELQS